MSIVVQQVEGQCFDFVQAERIATLREQRREEICQDLGLDRQSKIVAADRLYKRVSFLNFLMKVHPLSLKNPEEHFRCSNLEGSEVGLTIGWFSGARVRVDSVGALNRKIPYPALLAMKEARDTKLFDRFVAAASSQDFTVEVTSSDPILLGVIDSPTCRATEAIYYIIAEWE